MDLRGAIVVLGAPLPHAKVGCTIGALHVVHEILNKGHLVVGVDDLQAGGYHLDKEKQVEGNLGKGRHCL